MFRVGVKRKFSAAHSLREYDGNCERLHGHNWVVEAIIKGDDIDHLGMLVDFRVVKKGLDEILDSLDHRYLNELPIFKNGNPSSENIAKYIYHKLSGIMGKGVQLVEVKVWESDDSWASYSEE